MTERNWPHGPGKIWDRKGVPIMPGDLVQTYHFTGPRRKRYYLYHVAVLRDEGYLEFVPTTCLSHDPHGGKWTTRSDVLGDAEVIHGYSMEGQPYYPKSYEDRPRRAVKSS